MTSLTNATTSRDVTLPRQHDILATAARPLAFGAALTNTWTGVRIAGVGLADFLLVAASVLVVLGAGANRRRLPIYGWAVFPPITLLLIALIGSVTRGDPLSSTRGISEWSVNISTGASYGGAIPLVLRLTLSLTAVSIIVVGLGSATYGGRSMVKTLMSTWAMGAALSAAYGLLGLTPVGELLHLRNLPFLSYYISPNRVTGLAHHPNSFGITIALAMPMLMYLLGATRGWRKGVLALAQPVCLYAIFLSGSRAAMLGGAVLVVATLAYLVYHAKRIPTGALLLSLLLLPAAVAAIPEILSASRFFTKSAQLSNAARASALQRGIDLFKENPLFGAGVGSWTGEFIPLILLTSGGVVFFAVFYGCLSYPILRRNRDIQGPFVPILVISSIGVLGFGLLNNGIAERYLYWPFAALYAMSILSAQQAKHSMPVDASD